MKGKTVISKLKRYQNLIGLVLLGLGILGGSVVYALTLLREPAAEVVETPESAIAPAPDITALGRIEPLGQVIAVSAPPALGGAKVERLLVEEGDRVAVDQIIAQLDNYERLQAALETARRELTVAEAALNIVEAGAKQGEIQAAEARIATLISQQQGQRRTNQATAERLQAALNTAQAEYNRYQSLYNDGVVSASQRDQRQLEWVTAQKELAEAVAAAQETDSTLSQQIREAQAQRDRIAEVRPVEVAQARAQVGQAEAQVRQAVTDLELGIVRSPITGQVLKIHARPGETIEGGSGILDLGRTDQMVVVAEVYESEITQVTLNQKATITSENNTFSEPLEGRVAKIGRQVGRRAVLDTNPAADVDVRVVEVEILLSAADSQVVAGLTNAKVIAQIHRASTP